MPLKLLFLLLACSYQLAAEDLKPIKFGFIARLSGDGSNEGLHLVRGAELALKEERESIKSAGYQLKAIFEDYGNFDLKKAASAAQKLINIDKVDLLFPYTSEDIAVVWPIGHKAKKPMIAIRPGGIKVGEFSPYLVRVSSHDRKFYDLLFEHALAKGFQRIAIVSALSSYYTPMTEYARDLWEKKTGNKPLVLEYQITDVSFQSGLVKIKHFAPDLLVTINWNQSHIYRQARELGLSMPFAGVYYHVDDQIKLLPKNVINGAIFPRYTPATKGFEEKYLKEYKEAPGEVSDYAYDAVKIAIYCLKHNKYKSDKIIACILKLKDYPGASGLVNFTEEGDRVPREVRIYQVLDGEYLPVLK